MPINEALGALAGMHYRAMRVALLLTWRSATQPEALRAHADPYCQAIATALLRA